MTSLRDPRGNVNSEALSLDGAAPTVTGRSYNPANPISNTGFVYDTVASLTGNLLSDGTNAYTWDRANRRLSMGGASYGYDGTGNRIRQTVGANVTQYLIDVQPGLSVVLAAAQGANTTRYVHGSLGIHAHKDTANNWEWPLQDGLGNVREVADNTSAVLETRQYEPYGTPFGTTGMSQTMYGFTGEPTDGTGLVHLRARHYAPGLGVFTALDPLELLNRYQYVFSNPINMTDPTGLQPAAACASNPTDALFCTLTAAASAIGAGVSAPVIAAGVTGVAVLGFSGYLVNGVINADWAAYQAYENTIAAANEGRYPNYPDVVVPQSTDYPDEFNDPDRWSPPPPNNSPNGLGRLLAALVTGVVGYGLARFVQDATCPQPQPTMTPGATPMATSTGENWVVRAGTAAANTLQSGYRLRTRPPIIYGFSVQYRPGISLKDLAQVGFPNAQLSYAKDVEVIAAGLALGFVITIPITSGSGDYHATVTVNDRNGNNISNLSDELAAALSVAFLRKMSNPNIVSR